LHNLLGMALNRLGQPQQALASADQPRHCVARSQTP
jgi:hypothetical protein